MQKELHETTMSALSMAKRLRSVTLLLKVPSMEEGLVVRRASKRNRYSEPGSRLVISRHARKPNHYNLYVLNFRPAMLSCLRRPLRVEKPESRLLNLVSIRTKLLVSEHKKPCLTKSSWQTPLVHLFCLLAVIRH